MAEKKGLGRGLGALLRDVGEIDTLQREQTQQEKQEYQDKIDYGQIKQININMVDPNPNQPRKVFEDSKLRELAASIENSGIISPLIVQKSGERYNIIAGERRWRAARMAGLKTVPVVVRNYSVIESMEIALVENLQREDLNPIEEAKGIKVLMQQHNLTQEEVASKIGKSRPTISNSIRLLALPESIIELLNEEKISTGHAKCILSVEKEEDKLAVAAEILKKHLSVRQTEAFCKHISQYKQDNKLEKKEQPNAALYNIQNELQLKLETKVKIAGNSNKGKIIIEYFSKEQLEKLYEVLND